MNKFAIEFDRQKLTEREGQIVDAMIDLGVFTQRAALAAVMVGKGTESPAEKSETLRSFAGNVCAILNDNFPDLNFRLVDAGSA